MSKPLVLTTAPLSPWLSAGLARRYDVRPLAMAGALRDRADVVVTTGTHGLSAAEMDGLPALRLVAVHGVGYDRVDVSHAATRGIVVTNTPDVLTDDVADMAITLLLAVARGVASNDRFVRDGHWAAGGSPPLGRRVSGARFGILGLGRIGSAIARRLEPFAGRIAYHNRRPVADCRWSYVDSARALAAQSDFLIVATSGGAESAHLVDADVIAALGPDGYLVNIGRGGTVDQPALIEALVAGRLAGAGLDVFATEPTVPDTLIALDRVVLQPHQASGTTETRIAMADLVLANVDAHFAARPPITPIRVNPIA